MRRDFVVAAGAPLIHGGEIRHHRAPKEVQDVSLAHWRVFCPMDNAFSRGENIRGYPDMADAKKSRTKPI